MMQNALTGECFFVRIIWVSLEMQRMGHRKEADDGNVGPLIGA